MSRKHPVEKSLGTRCQVLGLRLQQIRIRHQHLGVDCFIDALNHTRCDHLAIVSRRDADQLPVRALERSLCMGRLQSRHAVGQTHAQVPADRFGEGDAGLSQVGAAMRWRNAVRVFPKGAFDAAFDRADDTERARDMNAGNPT